MTQSSESPRGRPLNTTSEPVYRTYEPIEIAAANTILQEVVNTPDSSFTDGADLSTVGRFGIEQVRKAFRVMSIDVLDTHEVENQTGVVTLRRDTSNGDLILRAKHSYISGEPDTLEMSLHDKYAPLIECEIWVGLNAPGSLNFTKFRDSREKPTKEATMFYATERGLSIEEFRYLFRGMRWVASNLLNWDRNFKLPEDLDRLPLTSDNSTS